MLTPNPYALFPPLNAALNGISAVLIGAGHMFMHRGRIAAHRACMIAAVISSTIFLACYLYYHSHAGVFHFRGTGWTRPIYFTILLSHTILAAALLPLVPTTLILGLSGRIPRHKVIARWTYPIWMYVSITGVLVYFMVYRWFTN